MLTYADKSRPGESLKPCQLLCHHESRCQPCSIQKSLVKKFSSSHGTSSGKIVGETTATVTLGRA